MPLSGFYCHLCRDVRRKEEIAKLEAEITRLKETIANQSEIIAKLASE